ncbi:hypothetical protein TSUD_393810 [Trifolium subterraneum]|uniref:Uncharacterized protein n=1 Tax=Trifolium subterraneum TaxID=3900 RepID=A0A2Z6MPV4_TRISU|nr:hypothetical protein TSUD_393810 [Trifolium subterraneum]
MSSAKSRNFRRRADTNDEEETTTSTPTLPSKLSAGIPKTPQAPKLLSFVDDEETDTTKTLRPRSFKPSHRSSKPSSSSSSHKITTHKDRFSHSPSPSNVQPQAGTYTKEALCELQKNTRTLVTPSSASRPISSDPKPSSEPVIVLKGLLKPKSDSEEDHREELEAKFASVGIQNDGKYSDLPDEETIKAIRAKRERLRQVHPPAPDYISLDGGSNHRAAEGLSDEEPEFRSRIAMFQEKVGEGKKGVFEVVDDRVDERFGDVVVEEEDEEEKMWEEAQFRKGLGKRMDEGPSRVGGGGVPNVAAATLANTSIGGAIHSNTGFRCHPYISDELFLSQVHDQVIVLKTGCRTTRIVICAYAQQYRAKAQAKRLENRIKQLHLAPGRSTIAPGRRQNSNKTEPTAPSRARAQHHCARAPGLIKNTAVTGAGCASAQYPCARAPNNLNTAFFLHPQAEIAKSLARQC